MSTKNKNTASTGVRYTDEQKKEVIDFVKEYNATKGRGGQSVASKKFKVTPLTIAAWMKAAGVSTKSAKSAKSSAPVAGKYSKPSKPSNAPRIPASPKGVRYTPEQKQEVIDFITDYNASNGRGGQSAAVKHFKLSAITVAAWLKKAGMGKLAGKPGRSAAASVPSVLTSKVSSLLEVSEQIRKTEIELEKLRAKFDSLRASIQASI